MKKARDQKDKRPDKKNRRRRPSLRRYFIHIVLLLFISVTALAALSLTVWFGLEEIEVEISPGRYKAQQIIEASQLEPGENLIRMNTKAAGQRIEDAFPYVLSAKLRRVLPNKAVIEVKLAQPAEAVMAGGEYILIDERHRVLETGLPLLPQGFRRAAGFEEAKGLSPGDFLPDSLAERFKTLRQLSLDIECCGFEGIDIIDLSDILNLRLLYKGKIIIELGSRLDLDYKVRLAQAALRAQGDGALAGVLDVSQRPAARLRAADIYDEALWPFPKELLEEYVRAVDAQNIFAAN